jgi:hypothetical protein
MMSSAFRALTFMRLPRACGVRYMARFITPKTPLLVTPNALQQLRSSADVNILDASWFMPNTPRNASKEFIEKRIPDARYLDLDEVAAPSELGFKHMMPSTQVFADALGTPIGKPATQHNGELMIPQKSLESHRRLMSSCKRDTLAFRWTLLEIEFAIGMILMGSSQHHGRSLCSDLSATSDRVFLMAVFPGGNLKDSRLSLALWWRFR